MSPVVTGITRHDQPATRLEQSQVACPDVAADRVDDDVEPLRGVGEADRGVAVDAGRVRSTIERMLDEARARSAPSAAAVDAHPRTRCHRSGLTSTNTAKSAQPGYRRARRCSLDLGRRLWLHVPPHGCP